MSSQAPPGSRHRPRFKAESGRSGAEQEGRVLAIVNPTAGRGAAVRAWESARRVLDAPGTIVDVACTSGPGEATRLASGAARDGARLVIAVGGDGTVHEVANGLLESAAGDATITPMAVIPAGSGNDFVKQLGVPLDPAGAAKVALTGSVARVDAGRAGATFFVNGVGVGFDARVAMEARSIRLLRGTPLYALALLRVLRRYEAPRLRLEMDGREVRNSSLTLVTIANGPCCGGGFWLCPAARLDDGVLDVLIAERTTRRRILSILGSALRGRHLGLREVEIVQGRSIRITGEQDLPVHADGEILTPGRTLEIEILPARLSVVVPAPGLG